MSEKALVIQHLNYSCLLWLVYMCAIEMSASIDTVYFLQFACSDPQSQLAGKIWSMQNRLPRDLSSEKTITISGYAHVWEAAWKYEF